MWNFMWNSPPVAAPVAQEAHQVPAAYQGHESPLLALYVDRYAPSTQFEPRELKVEGARHNVFAIRSAVSALLLPLDASSEQVLTVVYRQLKGGLVLWYRTDEPNGPESGVLLGYEEQSGCFTSPSLDDGEPIELEWPPKHIQNKRQRRSKKAI